MFLLGGPLGTGRKLICFAQVRFIHELLGSTHWARHDSEIAEKRGSELWGNLGDETQTPGPHCMSSHPSTPTPAPPMSRNLQIPTVTTRWQ